MQQTVRMTQIERQPSVSPVPHEADDDTIDLVSLFRTLWRGKWIIAICSLLFLVIAFFYVNGQDPQFRATAKVMFDLEQQNITDIEDVITRGEFSNDDLQNQIEVLRSTALIERVIEQLRLAEKPEFNPALRPEPLSLVERYAPWFSIPPELREVLTNAGILAADGPAPDPALEARRQRLSVIENVLDGLTLSPVRNSTVIEIGYTSTNPATAARIANAIAEQYIIEQLEGRLEATRSATDWLSERVIDLKDKVEEAESAVADAQSRLAAESGQTLEITQAQLIELNSARTTATARRAAIAAKLERLEQGLQSGANVASVPEFRDAPLIQGFRVQESELVTRAVQLRENVGENHPSVQRLNLQIEELRRKIQVEAEQIVVSVRVELDAADALISELSDAVRELEEKILGQSADEIELRQLEREAQAARLLYENFLNRLQETSQQESLQSADARVITPAEVPNGPLTHSRNRILAVGVILGGLVGVGIVFLLNALNNTFRGPQQVETEAGINVLASVPIIGKRVHRRDVIDLFRNKPNSSLAEAIRNLRTSILFSDVDNPPKAIAFTSSIPREGKSTTATLVALTSKQMGRSAILVDCDFRLPALSKILQVDEDKPGILSYMNGSAELEDCLSVEADTGLHVLMARASETKSIMNPADVLSSKRFLDLIEKLKEQYDLVILDAPPTLVVTDARIISQVCDAVVFAIRWDSTARGAVLEGLKELRSIGAPLIGAVLTLVNESRAAQYAYDGYGYGYYRGKYKDYYVD